MNQNEQSCKPCMSKIGLPPCRCANSNKGLSETLTLTQSLSGLAVWLKSYGGQMTTFPEETVECTNEQIVEYLKSNDPLVEKLINKFKAFIDNLEALKDDAWLEHAIKGFEKPDVEARIEKAGSHFYDQEDVE